MSDHEAVESNVERIKRTLYTALYRLGVDSAFDPSGGTLRIAEAVAVTTTVVAFGATVLAIDGSPAVIEANPVSRWIVGTAGWAVAGCLAVATVTGVFAVYRSIQNTAPRVVFTGAALVVVISAADMASSLAVWERVRFARTVDAGTVVPILATVATAVALWLFSRRLYRR